MSGGEKFCFLSVITSPGRNMDIEKLTSAYASVKEPAIKGRTVTPECVSMLLKADGLRTEILGESVLGRPISSFEIGNGETRVLLWTQMHGNEPTATGAVFDLLNFFRQRPLGFEGAIDKMLADFTVKVIPMLNPDGAWLFRRTNALDIDLNRDALALSAPESRILRAVSDAFRPHYCFNLHDQRNIYNVKGAGRTATISFLAPAEEFSRAVTASRKRAMAVIAAMNEALQQVIPGHVGRYSDEFYPTATGDNFQKRGFATMLIESGTFPGDPERQTARFCNFTAILTALEYLSGRPDVESDWEKYDEIPPNDQRMMDIIVRGVEVERNGCRAKVDVGIMLSEWPSQDWSHMECRAFIEAIGDLRFYYGIQEIGGGGRTGIDGRLYPQVGEEVSLPVVLGD